MVSGTLLGTSHPLFSEFIATRQGVGRFKATQFRALCPAPLIPVIPDPSALANTWPNRGGVIRSPSAIPDLRFLESTDAR